MAQRVQVLLTDDLDGGEATETITFALDGTPYEIDLSEDNARKLRKDIGPWVDAARRAGSSGTPQPRRRVRDGRPLAIRTWAREQGYKISDFGRLPPAIVSEYDAAH